MKKFSLCLLTVLYLVFLLSCRKGKNETAVSATGGGYSVGDGSDGITCDIRFAEEVDDYCNPTKYYDGNRFEINKPIYVIVDFTMTNYGSEDDTIDFEIKIPCAKYYSTYEVLKGVIFPKPEIVEDINDSGKSEKAVKLSGMNFIVKGDQKPFHYTYCVEISGIEVCDNAEFRAIFKSENGKVIARNKTFSKRYSFYK